MSEEKKTKDENIEELLKLNKEQMRLQRADMQAKYELYKQAANDVNAERQSSNTQTIVLLFMVALIIGVVYYCHVKGISGEDIINKFVDLTNKLK